MTDKPVKWWWVAGAVFMACALVFLLLAIVKGKTVSWVMFSSNFALGLFFHNAASARRRAARNQGAGAPTDRGA